MKIAYLTWICAIAAVSAVPTQHHQQYQADQLPEEAYQQPPATGKIAEGYPVPYTGEAANIQAPVPATPVGYVNPAVEFTGPQDLIPVRPGKKPMRLYCPECRDYRMSKIKKKPSLMTYGSSGCCLFFGCWLGCCLIPCCVDEMKDYNHICSECKNPLVIRENDWTHDLRKRLE